MDILNRLAQLYGTVDQHEPRAVGWREFEATTDDEIETLDEALFETAHLIAGLAAADGAVVMSKHNELLGFGGMISGRLPDVERVWRALDLEGEEVAEEADRERGRPPPLGLPSGRRAARIGGGRDLPGRGRALRVPERRPRHLLGARVKRHSLRSKGREANLATEREVRLQPRLRSRVALSSAEFVREPALAGFPRPFQRVEKVGFELVATTTYAPARS